MTRTTSRRLSQAAIDLLGRLSEKWTDATELEVDTSAEPWRELERQRLAEIQFWPPYSKASRVPWRHYRTTERPRRTEVRVTGRGALRLDRIRSATRGRPRRAPVARPLVIHHAHCADGFAAAWVAHRHFEARGGCELLAADYGDAPPAVDGRDVVIVDFSYPRDVLLEMRERAHSLLVLDHHRTAEEALRGLPFVTFDMGRSGAGLAWDRFFPDVPRPWIVDYVEDRDLWRWALPDSRAVSAYLRTIAFDLEAWTRIADEPVEEVASRGRAILAYVDALVRSHVERAAPAELAGHTVPVVNATAAVSETGNALARNAPFAVIWSIASDGAYLYSLRSCRENPEHVDVSEVARAFGGGGHRHAAGFRSATPVHQQRVS